MKVIVLYCGSILERNRVAKVVKFMADNANSFKLLCGHSIEVIDLKIIKNTEKAHKSFSTIIKSIIAHNMGGKIRRLYGNSYIGTRKSLEKKYWGRSLILLDNYKSLGLNDKVFIFHGVFTCWAYIKSCQKEKIPLGRYILVLHSNGEPFKMLLFNFPVLKETPYLKEINKRYEECAIFIVFVSELSAKTFKNLYPEYSCKVRVVPNGISKETNTIEPVFDGKLRMITVGTVCKRKNQIVLIHCLKDIREHGVDATLKIVGGGPKLDN